MAYNMFVKLVDFLKTRFSEHYHQMINPHRTDNFLYRHFKQTNHSPSNMFIQHVEKIIYDSHSTKRYRNILQHELELKLMKNTNTTSRWFK